MPASIRAVALVLVLSGLGGFVMGFSLLPTDVSRAWLIVGATLFAGGMVSLAIGYATKTITAALALLRDQVSAPIASDSPSSPDDSLAIAPQATEAGATQQAWASQHEMSQAEPELSAPSPKDERGSGGLLAAGGALLGAGAGLFAARKSREPVAAEATAAAPGDEFESDLFAHKTHPAADEPVIAPEYSSQDLPEAEQPDMGVPDMGVPDMGVPDMDLRLSRAPEPASESPAVVPLVQESALERPAPLPDTEDNPQAVTPASPVVSGLIADDDLAALQGAPPLLAPLETLEIVGAYDSGGVRFTMYSDGSVHAQGEAGEKRYPSLQALRDQLDSGNAAV